jgi:uncharacterized protein (DUF305 family)
MDETLPVLLVTLTAAAQMPSAREPLTADVDHNFAAMMVPHHEGAIDMAKAELSYGKDP